MSQPVDRSTPPPASLPRDFQLPPFSDQRLANGLRLIMAPQNDFPLLNLQFITAAGAMHDPAHLPGLARIHGTLLDEGTEHRSGPEIARQAERIGAHLGTGAGWNVAYAEFGLLARNGQAGLELLAEVCRQPSFPEDEIERTKEQQATELLRRRMMPMALAEDHFVQEVYRGTIYGQPLFGTKESLAAMQRQDFVDFHRRHVVPADSCFMAVGDFDPEVMRRQVEDLFGDWAPATPVADPVIQPTPLPASHVHIIDRPGAAQTQLLIGHASVPRNHPDYHALLLLNTLFGGKFTSRLNLNLRETHGYTYSINSLLVRRRGPGPMQIRTAVATDVAGAASREILQELRRLCDEKVSQTELTETQQYVTGIFPYTLQTIVEMTQRLELLYIFGLPDDFYADYPAVLSQITRDDLLRVARQHIHPDNLAIVVVGPADQLRPQFEDLAPITVHQA